MSAERLQCPAALELGSALSGSNLQLFAHAAVATLWRNSELDRQIFDMNLIPGLQQAIVRLTADRWCEVCTPAHFNSGNLIDVHSLEKFRSTPRYKEYRPAEINYGIKHALRVYTVSAEEELFTAIEAFDDIRVYTPPMRDTSASTYGLLVVPAVYVKLGRFPWRSELHLKQLGPNTPRTRRRGLP